MDTNSSETRRWETWQVKEIKSQPHKARRPNTDWTKNTKKREKKIWEQESKLYLATKPCDHLREAEQADTQRVKVYM